MNEGASEYIEGKTDLGPYIVELQLLRAASSPVLRAMLQGYMTDQKKTKVDFPPEAQKVIREVLESREEQK